MMQPEMYHPSSAQDDVSPHGLSRRHHAPRIAQSLSGVRRLQSDESWIEVSSQPSSSSLSSAAADDTNPAALGVQFDQYGRRRRRLLRNNTDPTSEIIERPVSMTEGSSQDEYEESESESDRVMTSSNENIENQASDGSSPQATPLQAGIEAVEQDDDDDGDATALGVRDNAPAFTPPPNAFSHPNHGQTYNAQLHTREFENRTSYFPSQRNPVHRTPSNSYPSSASRPGHSPYSMLSSNRQSDNDAALRASLSTLLSCAAAARGLPKPEGHARRPGGVTSGPSNQIQPSTLRLIPESILPSTSSPGSDGDNDCTDPTNVPGDRPGLPPRPRSPSATSSKKPKRKASPSGKDRTGTNKKKKARAQSPQRSNNPLGTNMDMVQPTLLTWVMSAGAVIIFSAISFSAGYAIGREVGRMEAEGAMREEGVVCGREVGRGLRRLRWGSGASSLSVIRT